MDEALVQKTEENVNGKRVGTIVAVAPVLALAASAPALPAQEGAAPAPAAAANGDGIGGAAVRAGF